MAKNIGLQVTREATPGKALAKGGWHLSSDILSMLKIVGIKILMKLLITSK
jgi:hypothetical protein